MSKAEAALDLKRPASDAEAKADGVKAKKPVEESQEPAAKKTKSDKIDPKVSDKKVDNGKKTEENGDAETKSKDKTQQKQPEKEVTEKQASNKSASSKSDPLVESGKAKKRDPLGKAGGGSDDDSDEEDSDDDNTEDEGGSAPDDEEEDIEAVFEGEGRLDALEDRIYDDEMVGRRVRAEFNDEGWSTGFITWFNTRLNEFRAEFEDGSEDYFKKDEIDGVEIILLPPDPEKDRKPGKPAEPGNKDKNDDDIEEKMKALHEGETEEEEEEDDEKDDEKKEKKDETKKEESSSVKKDESKKEEVPKKRGKTCGQKSAEREGGK